MDRSHSLQKCAPHALPEPFYKSKYTSGMPLAQPAHPPDDKVLLALAWEVFSLSKTLIPSAGHAAKKHSIGPHTAGGGPQQEATLGACPEVHVLTRSGKDLPTRSPGTRVIVQEAYCRRASGEQVPSQITRDNVR